MVALKEGETGLERLWAPWRMRYIEKPEGAEPCIFCRFPSEENDEKNLVLFRGEHGFLVLNAFPYSNGHLMVAPYRHTADLNDLSEPELLELMLLSRRALNLLTAQFRPDGFNMGANLGRVAGAGIADHAHIHIVPRWNGDTNFMPVLAETRVIPESLEAVFARLRMAIDGK